VCDDQGEAAASACKALYETLEGCIKDAGTPETDSGSTPHCTQSGLACGKVEECCTALGCENGKCCAQVDAKCLADAECCSGTCGTKGTCE